MEPRGRHVPCTDGVSVHGLRCGGHVPKWVVGSVHVRWVLSGPMASHVRVGAPSCPPAQRSWVSVGWCCPLLAAGRCGGHPPPRCAARTSTAFVGRLMRRRRGAAFWHDVGPCLIDAHDSEPARNVALDGPETPPARPSLRGPLVATFVAAFTTACAGSRTTWCGVGAARTRRWPLAVLVEQSVCRARRVVDGDASAGRCSCGLEGASAMGQRWWWPTRISSSSEPATSRMLTLAMYRWGSAARSSRSRRERGR
jgi:hypothetical protein